MKGVAAIGLSSGRDWFASFLSVFQCFSCFCCKSLNYVVICKVYITRHSQDAEQRCMRGSETFILTDVSLKFLTKVAQKDTSGFWAVQ